MAIPGSVPVWIVSVRKTGHLNQCRALVTALGTEPERTLLIDGKAAADRQARKLALRLLTPWQVLRALLSNRLPRRLVVISSGRAPLALCRIWRRLRRDRLFVVQVGMPRRGADVADILVASRHQGAAGEDGDGSGADAPGTIIVDGVLARPPAALTAIAERAPAPRHIAMLVGGKNVTFDYDGPRFRRALEKLAALRTEAEVSVVFSRRTYPRTAALIRARLADLGIAFIEVGDREGFASTMAGATHLVVCPDSITMISECCASGRPVFVPGMDVLRPGHENARFIQQFIEAGYALPFDAFAWEAETRPLGDEAARIAPRILHCLEDWVSCG
ncbi:MAG: ELM1/GtrOC1 family putative glycosyltransferase [Pseudomonadota bacterium]